MSQQIGVYAVLNTLTQKRYIGSSAHLDQRRWDHFGRLKRGIHDNVHLQDAYNLDGSDAFVFEILELLDPSALIEREQFWIDFYSSADRVSGYNIHPKSDKSVCADETKERLSITQKRKGIKPPPHNYPTPETIRTKISKIMKAYCSEGEGAEHLKRLKDIRTGQKVSEETRQKMVEAAKRREERYRREGPRVLRRTLA